MLKKQIRKAKRKLSGMLSGNDAKYGKLSFSQGGEDLIINTVFTLRGIQKPTYIDIGANHPFRLSNTAIFYLRGARGINVEANPLLVELFKQERPEDTNLNVGIADQAGELDFYIMEDDTLSTFSREECEKMQASGQKLAGVRKVKLVTVADILEQHARGICPDLLTIDVEGLDAAILRSIDFSRYRPKVICVEAAEYSPIGAGERRSELIDFLVDKGYYEYANTNLNAIMVERSFWFI